MKKEYLNGNKMIPYKIFPMFQLGHMHINMYGIMFALSVLVASLLAAREAKKRKINPKVIWDLVFYLLLGILIGARLFYILFYWPKETPLTLLGSLAIWEGGLAFFGGLIGALATGYIYAKKKKLNFWVYADIFAVPLVIGHIFGRLGDYFTGGHPGKVTNLPWAIYLDNALRHPVVLYEIIGLIIITAILLNLRKHKFFKGFLFSSYVILYSIQRMILDFFRIESTDPRYLGLTPTQHLVIILFVLSAAFIWVNFRKIRTEKRLSKTAKGS